MFQLVYISTASKPMSEAGIQAILEHARKMNDQFGLTGMLVHNKGVFLQLLEGNKESVLNLYSNIKKDPRHKNVETLLELDAADRLFANWTMGYKGEKEIDPELKAKVSENIKNKIQQLSEGEKQSEIIELFKLFRYKL